MDRSVVNMDLVEEVCYTLLRQASIELPPEVEKAIRNAYEAESQSKAKMYFGAMLQNLMIAKEQEVPICQDTGVPLFYVSLGSRACIKGDLRGAVERAVERATIDVPLREQVSNPITKENSSTNVGWRMPPIFMDCEYGVDSIDITAVPRGGGAEVKSCYVVPVPGALRKEAILKVVVDSLALAGGEMCTPVIVGVAVGGFGLDYAQELARRAIYRHPLNSRHPNGMVADLEEQLYQASNKLGIGPMGVGGDTTCLGLHMEVAGTHSAMFPIAVAFSCWATRYSRAIIRAHDTVEYRTHPSLRQK
jgi:tartrate/fumarate subfamily iron-sulfur-dependent hydro-lyase alpha chain